MSAYKILHFTRQLSTNFQKKSRVFERIVRYVDLSMVTVAELSWKEKTKQKMRTNEWTPVN